MKISGDCGNYLYCTLVRDCTLVRAKARTFHFDEPLDSIVSGAVQEAASTSRRAVSV
jgi:hypothetical protein